MHRYASQSWRRSVRGTRRTTRARGFTLFELVLAVALVGMLFAAVLSFFWQTADARQQAIKLSDRTALARFVLDGIAAELRGVPGMEQVGFPTETRLTGTRRDITFLTTAMPDREQFRFLQGSETATRARHDLRMISYALWVDPNQTKESGDPMIGGITRIEQRTLNQQVVEEDDPNRFRQDLWAKELGYIEFRYFDGVEWDTKWELTEGNALPQLVEITVGFEDITAYELEDGDLQEQELAQPKPYRPDRYSTIVRMPAADRLFGSRVQRLGQQLSEQMGVGGVE